MSTEPSATRYPDMDTLSRALATQVAERLRAALEARGTASLVVSGGRSPIKFFESLRVQALDWSRVSIALADERWVDSQDPDSNEKLVRDHLLKEEAAVARFTGLKNGAPTPDLGAVSAWETFARVPRPFDVVMLGMGDDGHTASLFPHSPNLATALDVTSAAGCIGMWAPTAPQARLSLNLSALLDSRQIYLLLGGASKWQIYVAASDSGPAEEMPVRTVLRQKNTPVEVTWAPA
jgi:6-phosphogluconolactonase